MVSVAVGRYYADHFPSFQGESRGSLMSSANLPSVISPVVQVPATQAGRGKISKALGGLDHERGSLAERDEEAILLLDRNS